MASRQTIAADGSSAPVEVSARMTRFTRRRALGLVIAVSTSGVLAACAPSPPAPGTPSASRAAAPAQLDGNSAELVLGHFVPTKHELHARVLEPWARDVELRSSGRIRITIHPGGALGPAQAQYKNVEAGAMDIGLGVQSYTPGRFPLTESLELPFLWASAEQATVALQSLYESFPPVQREYDGVKVLSLWAYGPAQILTAKQQVKTLEDVRGLKIRSPGPIHNKVLESLGAVPLSMPVTEAYDAIERGVAGGTIVPPSAFTSFNLVDVIRYSAAARFPVASFFLVMNRQKWEALAPEDQRALADVTGPTLAIRAAKVSDQTDAEATEVARSRGVELYQLPADELDRWKRAAAAIPEQWIRDAESKRLPGRPVYDHLVRLSAADPRHPGKAAARPARL